MARLSNQAVHETLELDFFAGLDGELFQVGSHGHTHNRQSMLLGKSKRENLTQNVAWLRENAPNFVPLFAAPFGRELDVDSETRRICEEAEMTLLMADGGVNTNGSFRKSAVIRRVPSDSRSLQSLQQRLFY